MVVAQYLLTFREVLEAALLVAIIVAYLGRTGRLALTRYAWYGVYAAVGASLVLGAAVWILYGSLAEAQEKLFEATAAFVAVAVLTSMILWMATKARTIRSSIEGRVELAAATSTAALGLTGLAFVLVFREGLETVLFLTPFLVQDVGLTLLGAALGIGGGFLLAYAIFRVGIRLDLRRFFYFTSVLLILLAGGLLGYGIHELIEYGKTQGVALGWWAQSAYTLPFASTDPLHHKGIVGSIFAVLVGYSASPEWARVLAHAAYLIVALPLVVLAYRRPEAVARTAARLRSLLRPVGVRRHPVEERR